MTFTSTAGPTTFITTLSLHLFLSAYAVTLKSFTKSKSHCLLNDTYPIRTYGGRDGPRSPKSLSVLAGR